MHYFLFLLYFIGACFVVPRIPFVKKSGLPWGTIITLFTIKVAAGMIAGWLSYHYGQPNDYWGLHREGLIEYNILLTHPIEFFKDIFHSQYNNDYGGFFSSAQSYWNDLRTIIVIKLIALCNILSRGNFYTNTLIFNVFGIIGPVAFYRTFINIFPTKKTAIIIGSFLLPSTLLFSSAMHKDLIVFTCLGLFLYSFYFISTTALTFKKGIVISISLVALLLMRNFLFIALIPAVAGFILSYRLKVAPIKIFITIYLLIFSFLVVSPIISTSFQPLRMISQRQEDFLKLEKVASQLPMNNLEPSLKSFLSNSPQAINHGFLRPYLWDKGGKFTPFWSIELTIFFFIAILSTIQGNLKIIFKNRFLLFLLCFTISMFILIGYIVPNSSTIIRYKCIYMPLIIIPLLALIKKNNPVVELHKTN